MLIRLGAIALAQRGRFAPIRVVQSAMTVALIRRLPEFFPKPPYLLDQIPFRPSSQTRNLENPQSASID